MGADIVTPEGRQQPLVAELHRLADKLRDTGWQPFQVRDEINMGIRRVADRLALLLAEAQRPQVQENQEVARVETMGDSKDNPTAALNETKEATVSLNQGRDLRFQPKRACEGAPTIHDGDMRECPHGQCGVSIRWDLVDHPFFGFKAGCPLNRKSDGGNQPPSGLRGDPGAPRTVNGEARDEDSAQRGDVPENTTNNPKSWIAWKRRAERAEAQLAALPETSAQQGQEKNDQESRVDHSQYDPPSAGPLATAADNVLVPTKDQ